MDITWYGLSCFRIRENGTTIVCDPLDKANGGQMPKTRADIVTISNNQVNPQRLERITGEPKVLQGPGEYEVSNVLVTAMAKYPSSIGENGSQNGAESGVVNKDKLKRNTVYFFDFGDLTVGHLGELSEVPKQSDVDELKLGDVDVLILPVGGGVVLDPTRAVEMIGMLDPKLLIPMLYQQPEISAKWVQGLEDVEKFLKELGVTPPEPQNSLKVSKSSLTEETQVVLLKPGS